MRRRVDEALILGDEHTNYEVLIHATKRQRKVQYLTEGFVLLML